MSELSDTPNLEARILRLLEAKGNRILAIRDIHERLEHEGDTHPSREQVADVVEDLERRGEIVAVRGKRYSLLKFTPYTSGKIRIHPDGYGTLAPPAGSEFDVYVDRRATKGAMNGDLVLVRVEEGDPKPRKGGRLYYDGEVNRILQRAHTLVVGRFHDDRIPFLVPFDVRIDTDIDIYPESTLGAEDGEMVNVEIEHYGDQNTRPTGRVVERIGFIGEPGVDVEVVIRKYHIPHRFPDEVIAEAERIATTVPEEEIAKRVDLRERNIVTIDGETARDFDDAVDVERLSNGNFLLGVHIADVSHYVIERSELDKEAFERGTSVYFPGRVVPMLPEHLSNGVCSLNPRVDRLTFSAQIEIDPRGRFLNRKFFKSVIRTKERMTYTNVNAILTAPTDELRERYGYLWEDFERMHELFEVLRARRDARGSIDFDLPESEIVLDEEGGISAIRPSERNVAHRLIEEFMLAANEVVAQELVLSMQPGAFRVHAPPDAQKIEELKGILKEFNHKLRADAEQLRPGELQRVLREVAGTPEERFLTELVLRSMKRAIYSEENSGHFALGLQFYCHFTSPIRRYPDLVIHRRLQELLTSGAAVGDALAKLEAQLPFVTTQCSEREKRAEDAEREVMEWKKVIFMRDRVGERFSGRITGVMPFGLFVELEEIFVQGMVPIATIGGDYWAFADKEHRLRGSSSGREFRLGDAVVIEVERVDEDRRQIEFRLVEAGGVAIAGREPQKRSR